MSLDFEADAELGKSFFLNISPKWEMDKPQICFLYDFGVHLETHFPRTLYPVCT